MELSASYLVLGLINVLIWIVILLLIGAFAMWIAGALGYPVPTNIQKLYAALVGLIALAMIVALLFGMQFHRFVAIDGGSILVMLA